MSEGYDMEIRKATEKDIDAMVKIWHEMHVNNEKHDDRYYALKPKEEAIKIKKKLYSKLLNDPKYLMLVMDLDGRIIGYVYVEIIQRDPTFEIEYLAQINEVSVTKEFQEKGFFSSAYVQIMKILKNHEIPIKLIMAEMDLENPAISAYWKINFYKRAFRLICWTEDAEEFISKRMEKKQKKAELKNK